MSAVIVTNPDVDGVLAASVLVAGLHVEWALEPVLFANYQDFDDKLHPLLSLSPDDLYLTDLDVQEIRESTFQQLLSRTRLHVFDHHSGASERDRVIRNAGGSCSRPRPEQQMCSTELAIRAVGREAEPKLALLAGAARADDFSDEDTPKAAQRLAHILGGALMRGSDLTPRTIVERLTNEVRSALTTTSASTFAPSDELDACLAAAAERVTALQECATEALQIHRVFVDSQSFGNVWVACACVPDVLFGKPGVDLIAVKCPEAAVLAAFFADGACWVFPRGFPRGQIDLLPLLIALGGGGRDGGGGFGFRGPTTAQNYGERVEGLLAAIQTYGKEAEFVTARQGIPGGLRGIGS